MQNTMDAIRADVAELFRQDFSGHDMAHTERVAAQAVRIARGEGADERIVTLAALLHDADDRKLSPSTHAGKDNARRILAHRGVSAEDTERIVRIIGQISFSDGLIPDTLEGRVVQDADRVDAIGAIGIARTFAYGGSHHRPIYDPDDPPCTGMTRAEYAARQSTSINHFYEKLLLLKDALHTGTARDIAKKRHAFMEDFLRQFFDEWDGRA